MNELNLRVAGRLVQCTVEQDSGEFTVRIGDTTHRLRLAALEPGLLRLTIDDRSQLIHVAHGGERWFLHLDGRTVEYEVVPAAEGGRQTHRSARDDLAVPMPGVITQVLVREGDTVKPGQPLVIVEAMKMEHVLRSPSRGRIGTIRVRPGEQVEGGVVVAEIEEDTP